MRLMELARRIFKERRGLLVPLLALLALNVMAVAVAVVPLRSAVATAELEATSALSDLALVRRLAEQAARAQQSEAHADDELRRFYADVLPRDLPTAQKIMNLFVTNAAREAGLDFQGSRFEWNELRDSTLVRASSRITLRGGYASLRRFLQAVEQAEEFIVVERVELVQPTDQVTSSGALEVSLVVATYFAAGSLR